MHSELFEMLPKVVSGNISQRWIINLWLVIYQNLKIFRRLQSYLLNFDYSFYQIITFFNNTFSLTLELITVEVLWL